ncbi:hypothetical protein DPMN_027809 [Dreissena polymorpha]|uniref:Uncharacterized protein n=1 Tax=Dreissena polymorpha TaxID=45954 RepID=A0A9D4LW10_DREPO|nr:hypothetical protein DPMN_027809 [Dreissena polymorpha]
MRTKTVTNQMEVAISGMRIGVKLCNELCNQSTNDPGIRRCLMEIDVVSFFRPVDCKHICVFLNI